MDSKFDGGLLGLIGITILQFLLIVFTLTIGTAWAVCMKERWVAKHTVVDGKQLYFDGTGGQLFGKYVLWFLLTIVTVGIFALWIGIKTKKWVVKHTHMVDAESMLVESV